MLIFDIYIYTYIYMIYTYIDDSALFGIPSHPSSTATPSTTTNASTNSSSDDTTSDSTSKTVVVLPTIKKVPALRLCGGLCCGDHAVFEQ